MPFFERVGVAWFDLIVPPLCWRLKLGLFLSSFHAGFHQPLDMRVPQTWSKKKTRNLGNFVCLDIITVTKFLAHSTFHFLRNPSIIWCNWRAIFVPKSYPKNSIKICTYCNYNIASPCFLFNRECMSLHHWNTISESRYLFLAGMWERIYGWVR